MQLAKEETFGPVAAVFRFDTEDEVLAAANDTPYRPGRVLLLARHQAHSGASAARSSAGSSASTRGSSRPRPLRSAESKNPGYGREGSRRGLSDYMDMKYRLSRRPCLTGHKLGIEE